MEDISPLLLFAVPSNIFHFAPCCPFQKEHCKKESFERADPILFYRVICVGPQKTWTGTKGISRRLFQ